MRSVVGREVLRHKTRGKGDSQRQDSFGCGHIGRITKRADGGHRLTRNGVVLSDACELRVVSRYRVTRKDDYEVTATVQAMVAKRFQNKINESRSTTTQRGTPHPHTHSTTIKQGEHELEPRSETPQENADPFFLV